MPQESTARPQDSQPPSALRVEHFPNPSNLYTPPHPMRKPPRFPFVWYYRTEVTNLTDKALRIVQFESYFLFQGRWLAANVLRRPLDVQVFGRWYGYADRDEPIVDGLLLPGQTAKCDVNWHASQRPFANNVKWVFYAMDESGTLHIGEGELVSIPYSEHEHRRN